MYKQKYHKYKNKYLKFKNNIKGGDFNDPDIVDWYDADDLVDADFESILPEEDLFDEGADKKVEDIFGVGKGKFLGFDKDPRFDDLITEDLQQDIVDIGLYGKARGKLYNFTDFDKSDFTKLKKGSDKTKILMIKDKDSFDEFTKKYGKIGEDNNLYINWGLVRKDYKGFYLDSSALGNRDSDIPFRNRTVSNWVNYDYNFIDNVVIFTNFRNLINSRKISRPFKGRVVDEFSIEESEFARITDPITNDKILLIDDVRTFDKFTNKYGKLRQKGKEKIIDINWNEVNKDYDGFYIDKDNDFYEDRFEKAFYKDQLYPSWWKKNNIEQGIVYLFE